MRKKTEYKVIENGIEYLVIESRDYYYMNKYHSESKIDDPIKFTKFILNLPARVTEVYYMINNLDHNMYGPATTRTVNGKLIVSGYYLFGEWHTYNDWLKEKEKLLRWLKLNKLNLIYTEKTGNA